MLRESLLHSGCMSISVDFIRERGERASWGSWAFILCTRLYKMKAQEPHYALCEVHGTTCHMASTSENAPHSQRVHVRPAQEMRPGAARGGQAGPPGRPGGQPGCAWGAIG